MLNNINKHIYITFFSLIFVIAFFQFTNIDILVQNFFYNFDTKEWILDRNQAIYKLIFYDGVKKVLILFAVCVLFSLILFRKKELIKEYKKGLIIIVLSAILVPVVIGGLKDISNTPCPKDIKYFNGLYPNIKVFDSYPKDFIQKSKIKCWPAGHASGGFALLSLFFLFKSAKNRKKSLALAMSVGWSMGMYKTFIGDHYLSHTIITMLIAWLIILILAKYIKGNELEKSA